MGLGRALKHASKHIAGAMKHYDKIPKPLRRAINKVGNIGASVAAGVADGIAPGSGQLINKKVTQYRQGVKAAKAAHKDIKAPNYKKMAAKQASKTISKATSASGPGISGPSSGPSGPPVS